MSRPAIGSAPKRPSGDVSHSIIFSVDKSRWGNMALASLGTTRSHTAALRACSQVA